MGISRRVALTGLLVLLTFPSAFVYSGPHRRKRSRSRRHFWRRRIRQRVLWRTIGGRRLLVVPLGVAVGWELLRDDEVVVVKEVHTYNIVVEHKNGKTETIDIVKEDNNENSKDFEGSKYQVEEDE